MLAAVYRHDEVGVRDRIATLTDEYRAERARLPPALATLYARRVARRLAGRIAVVGAVSVFVLAVAEPGAWLSGQRGKGGLSVLLWGAAGAGMVSYVVGLWLGRRRWLERLFDALPASSDAHADLDRVLAARPALRLAQMFAETERASVLYPLLAAALLGPLLVHTAVAALLGVPRFDVDAWICASVILVGHCHLVLVGFVVHFARSLARRDGAEIASTCTRYGWRALNWLVLSTGASALLLGASTGNLWVFILGWLATGALVFATGLFVPLFFSMAGRRVAAERAYIAGTLPAATRH